MKLDKPTTFSCEITYIDRHAIDNLLGIQKDEVCDSDHTTETDKTREDDIRKPSRYMTSDGSETRELINIATRNLVGEAAFDTGCMVKYSCRWNKGNTPEKDIRKIREYAQMIKEFYDETYLTGDAVDRCAACMEAYWKAKSWMNDLENDNNLDPAQTYFAQDLIYIVSTWWMPSGDSNWKDNLDEVIGLCDKLIAIL